MTTVENKYYILNTKNGNTYDPVENNFYGQSWEIVYEDKAHLEAIIEKDPERFRDCIIKED